MLALNLLGLFLIPVIWGLVFFFVYFVDYLPKEEPDISEEEFMREDEYVHGNAQFMYRGLRRSDLERERIELGLPEIPGESYVALKERLKQPHTIHGLSRSDAL